MSVSNIVDRARKRIRFTNFIPPNGKRETLWFDMATPDAMDKAEPIVAAGFRFHVELRLSDYDYRFGRDDQRNVLASNIGLVAS